MTALKSGRPRKEPSAIAAVLADPRWEALASGDATHEDIADLRAWAEQNEAAADAWAACHPATEKEIDRLMGEPRQGLPMANAEVTTTWRADKSSKPLPSMGTPGRIIVRDSVSYKDAHDVANAGSRTSILIEGESGVGKKAFARAIHRASVRATQSFVIVDCASINSDMFELEFFGHRTGAFSAAISARGGLFERARGGTLLLEGVDKLPLDSQAKLVRVLEDRNATPAVRTEAPPIDVRFIVVTSHNLEAAVARGDFRGDLYQRLRGIAFEIPPLRRRPKDIMLLARLFLEEESRKRGMAAAPELSLYAITLLEQYEWPGNVRELRDAMMEAVANCQGTIVRTEHLPQRICASISSGNEEKKRLFRREESRSSNQRILDALMQSGFNQVRAAQALGISLRTLVNRLNQHRETTQAQKIPKEEELVTTKKPPKGSR